MEKLYTKEELASAIEQANKEHKLVKLVQKEVDYQVEVLEWNKKIIEVQKYDEEGNPMYDDGNPIMEEIEVDDHDNPIMVEETIIDPITGEEETVIVQKHHTETRVKVVEEIEIVEDEEKLDREFFNTSLGYVRRIVRMKDGTEKNFLADVLPLLQVGVQILVYDIDGNQSMAVVTEEFIKECQAQYLKDFYG